MISPVEPSSHAPPSDGMDWQVFAVASQKSVNWHSFFPGVHASLVAFCATHVPVADEVAPLQVNLGPQSKALWHGLVDDGPLQVPAPPGVLDSQLRLDWQYAPVE